MTTPSAQSAVKPPINGAPQAQGVAPDAKPPAAATALVEVAKSGEVVRVGFDTLQGFEALQRIGKLWASSSLVPDIYKGRIDNCVIALNMAARLRADPLMVMQNLYVVHGNPGWSSKFLIASFNQCGRFSAIRYRWSGEKGKASWGCTAYARELKSGDDVVGPEVTWQMAKSEGWTDKKGSKWLTLPDLMFMYRAAAFLVRTTAPELTMGLPTAEELADTGGEIEEVSAPRGVAGLRALVPQMQEQTEPPHDPTTGEVVTTPAADGAAQTDQPKIDAEPSKTS